MERVRCSAPCWATPDKEAHHGSPSVRSRASERETRRCLLQLAGLRGAGRAAASAFTSHGHAAGLALGRDAPRAAVPARFRGPAG
jgi:hypothetical protein